MTSKAKPKAKKKVTHKKVETTTPDEAVNGNDLSATVTNVEPDAPPKAKTIVHGQIPPVPPPEPDVRFDVDRPETLMPIIVKAWEEVRKPDDAHFGDAAPDFQRTLVDHAKDFFRTNVAQAGNTNLARFEQALKRIKDKGE